jgi:hypothetical protein
MPDSFGKRQRDQVKARKAMARDDRRVARNKRRKGVAPTEPSADATMGMADELDRSDGVHAPTEAEPGSPGSAGPLDR